MQYMLHIIFIHTKMTPVSLYLLYIATLTVCMYVQYLGNTLVEHLEFEWLPGGQLLDD